VVISGGMGSLGQLLATFLAASNGTAPAARLTLWGRSASGQLPAALTGGSCPVTTLQCDSAAAVDVAAAADEWCRGTACYVHAGGVLQDALLPKQSAASLRAAAAPKLAGQTTAVRYLQYHPLHQLLAFSSVAALLGNAGQANYAAANSAMDAAAAVWQQQGVEAASLQWGPWAGGGMATPAVAAALAAKGVGLVRPAAGLQLLGRLLAGRSPLLRSSSQPHPYPASSSSSSSTSSCVSAPLVAIDWQRMLRPAQRRSPFFAGLTATSHAQAAAAEAAAAAVPSLAEVQAQVAALAGGVLGSDSLDPSLAFMAAGLDSLGAWVWGADLAAGRDAAVIDVVCLCA
jgi:hypothetical protein